MGRGDRLWPRQGKARLRLKNPFGNLPWEWRMVPAFLVGGLFLTPLIWMVLTSFKLPPDTAALPPRFLPGDLAPENSFWFRFTWSNYGRVFGDSDTLRSIFNSLWVSIASTLLSLAAGSMAGYGLSRYPSYAVRRLQFLILGTRLLPSMALAVPISFMFSRIGLHDTRFGLVLLYTTLNLSLATWMMKSFFDEIPPAFEESARLEGYTRMQAFRWAVMPQVLPGLSATAVLCFLSSWNEYTFALTLTSIDAITLPVRVHAISADTTQVPWGPMAAAGLISALPPIALTFWMRRNLLRGMTLGAIKE
jgi:multiple sugar transport system permease protein